MLVLDPPLYNVNYNGHIVKTVKLAIWAVSLNFLFDFTLFVIDIHHIMLISLFPAPFDHFHFHPTLGLDPALILTLRHMSCIFLVTWPGCCIVGRRPRNCGNFFSLTLSAQLKRFPSSAKERHNPAFFPKTMELKDECLRNIFKLFFSSFQAGHFPAIV